MENLSGNELLNCTGGSVVIMILANKILKGLSKIVDLFKNYGRLA